MSEGALLLDKPADTTSFGVLSGVKRTFETKRVGHTGTLDRFATGLMVVLVGRATRLADLATNQDKRYLFDIVFGTETDTLDPTGQVVGEGRVPERREVEEVLQEFTGELEQVPPAYSAVHVNGKRASDLARAGEAPPLQARRIRIDELVLVSMEEGVAHVRTSCSKGTYVRSLARDIAGELGTVGHVGKLRRTRVGAFEVSEAVEAASIRRESLMSPREFLERLDGVGTAHLDAAAVEKVRHGTPLREEHVSGGMPEERVFAVLDPTSRVVAVVERTASRFKYRVVFS